MTNMRKKKFNERIFVDELPENQDAAILIFSRNTLAFFLIFYGMKETNRQNKHMLLLFLKKKIIVWKK